MKRPPLIAPPQRCDSRHSTDHPLDDAVIQGQAVRMCIHPTPCLSRARAGRIGMWAA